MIENVSELLRFEVVRGLREAGDVREKDRKLLAFGGDFYILLAGEDGLVNLRRKILRQLGGQGFEYSVLFSD